MDLDKAFVASVVQGGRNALKTAVDRGIGLELLQGEGREAYRYIQEHYSKYGEIPGFAVLEGKLGICIETVSDSQSVEFFATTIFERDLSFRLAEGLKSATELLEKRKPVQAFEGLQELVFLLNRLNVGDSKITSIFSMGKEVIDYYNRMKAGERGILTPWPAINESTLGFGPEELILFAARSGVGKSWVAVLLAKCAWESKKRVLFVTTEMSKLRIALRFYSILYKLPYGQFRAGRLNAFSEKSFYERIEETLHEKGLDLIGGNFDFRTETIGIAIDDCKPDIVIIDGIYLLKALGQTRTEKLANVFDEIKRLTVHKKLPIVVTSQFNREVKVNQANTARMESVALTDAAVWHSTIIFGLVQTDDMKEDRRMMIKQLKLRDGVGKDVELNWDFDRMDFSELAKDPAATFGSGGDIIGGELAGGDDLSAALEPQNPNVPF